MQSSSILDRISGRLPKDREKDRISKALKENHDMYRNIFIKNGMKCGTLLEEMEDSKRSIIYHDRQKEEKAKLNAKEARLDKDLSDLTTSLRKKYKATGRVEAVFKDVKFEIPLTERVNWGSPLEYCGWGIPHLTKDLRVAFFRTQEEKRNFEQALIIPKSGNPYLFTLAYTKIDLRRVARIVTKERNRARNPALRLPNPLIVSMFQNHIRGYQVGIKITFKGGGGN